MRFSVITLFPESLAPYLDASIIGRARQDGIITTELVNLRDFADDKHRTVDDTPYGGGPGMVLKIEPIAKALDSIKHQEPNTKNQLNSKSQRAKSKSRTIVLSARGEQFTQAKAAEYARLDELVLICGRYEGIDQRVADHLADEELSVGPYVLAGGELPALTVLEATTRLLPGVLGNTESLTDESFSKNLKIENCKIENYVEYPHYTKPEDYNGWKVPPVLLSGNHAEIERWRKRLSRS